MKKVHYIINCYEDFRIETSCDETAASIVEDHPDPHLRILSNIIFSQIHHHQDYGGVVPELAARAHLEYLTPTLTQAIEKSGISCKIVTLLL